MDMLNHIISAKDFDKDTLLSFLRKVEKFACTTDLLHGKILATLFFEPSTRTRLSFESAMIRLGGQCISVADSNSCSTQKGETIYDTIRTVEGYADAIVIRHPLEGTARLATCASKLNIPIINGGDGSHEHPTQSLIDTYTIYKKFNRLDNLKIGYMGDLKYGRTVHSLTRILDLFDNNHHFFISPDDSLQIDHHHQPQKNTHTNITLENIIDQLDILYVTRLQKERFPDPMDYHRIIKNYQINPAALSHAKSNLIIMHPLPRNDEIHRSVDDLPQAHYFEQAHNGIPVRQTLLFYLLQRGGII